MSSDIIRCIFYSEFHDEYGPRIIYQVPEDVISKRDFETIHSHIITKRELHNHIVSYNFHEYQVVGCPMHVELEYKARNVLIFNMCFVFDATVHTSAYEMAIKKMGSYLMQLEIELQFLTNEETKSQLPDLMHGILVELNSCGYCHIPITSCTTIHLATLRERKDSPAVREHDVPVMINMDAVDISRLDLAVMKVLPYVDGTSHVAKIAVLADVELSTVTCCIKYLIERDLVKLIPVFQYSNVYVTTAQLRRLLNERSLLMKCIESVSLPGCHPNLRDIYEFYSALVAGTTVHDVCVQLCPRSNGIDERKLIQFGVTQGLIRRIQRYPVQQPTEAASSFHPQRVCRYLDGLHSWDEICCICGLSAKELEDFIGNDQNSQNVVIIWK